MVYEIEEKEGQQREETEMHWAMRKKGDTRN